MTSFHLKIIAIVAMTANHAAFLFASVMPEWLYCALIAVGGITFPIMAFLLVEGYRHTSDVKKYLIRLVVFAFVSQVPYTLAFTWGLNVMFTLAIGLGLMYLYDTLESEGLVAFLMIVGIAISAVCDWGVIGPLVVMLFYLWRNDPYKLVKVLGINAAVVALSQITNIANILYAVVGSLIAGLVLSKYNGERGYPLKWFFYAYYPAHLLLLFAVAKLLGV